MISTPSAPTSLSGHSHFGIPQAQEKHAESKSPSPTLPQFRRTWYGRKVITSPSECEKGEQEPSQRTTVLYAPAYNGFAAGLSVGKNAYVNQTY
ncbi:hypothetical protein JVT61DRAFT_7029 [Boletus reticuloceps]|uniref:Uncharacterized protein n=1 Tax=Boletus reticuloceps TaxID=495285 RepID=A0A8I2YK04_9AGAM|nr:hypothetical protein JVT61DRAFT_7029 [Boletus reticuloceps]